MASAVVDASKAAGMPVRSHLLLFSTLLGRHSSSPLSIPLHCFPLLSQVRSGAPGYGMHTFVRMAVREPELTRKLLDTWKGIDAERLGEQELGAESA